jgi:hypothetical protein
VNRIDAEGIAALVSAATRGHGISAAGWCRHHRFVQQRNFSAVRAGQAGRPSRPG